MRRESSSWDDADVDKISFLKEVERDGQSQREHATEPDLPSYRK